MEELEKLRNIVGPEAAQWSDAQLAQLDDDLDSVAVLLLDIYRSRREDRKSDNDPQGDLEMGRGPLYDGSAEKVGGK